MTLPYLTRAFQQHNVLHYPNLRSTLSNLLVHTDIDTLGKLFMIQCKAVMNLESVPCPTLITPRVSAIPVPKYSPQ